LARLAADKVELARLEADAKAKKAAMGEGKKEASLM